MKKPGISFFIMDFALLFALIAFILAVFELHRFAFVLELGVLLIFIALAALSMYAIYRNKKWGWTILGATLILLLLNTSFIFLLTGAFETAHLTIVFFSVIGLAVALWNLRETQKQEIGETAEYGKEHKKEEGYYPYIDKIEPQENAESQEAQKPEIKKTFTPGKFIASKKAGRFHSPKCDWAQKILKQNQLWFNTKEEAEANGFEADKCVS